MNDDRTLERAARSFIEVGPTRAPDHAVEAALLRIASTTQERALRLPWRFPTMPLPARLVALAVVGALVLAGLALLGTGGSRPPRPRRPATRPSWPPRPRPSRRCRAPTPNTADYSDILGTDHGRAPRQRHRPVREPRRDYHPERRRF